MFAEFDDCKSYSKSKKEINARVDTKNDSDLTEKCRSGS